METGVSILVKNESLLSRFFSLLWIINIFKKMSVNVYIDSEDDMVTLKADKEPYIIDLDPGEHTLVFEDPRAGGKSAFRAITGGFLGLAFGLAAGGSGIDEAISWGSDAGDGAVQNGVVQFELYEGDMLELSAKPTRKGGVKVKFLNGKPRKKSKAKARRRR